MSLCKGREEGDFVVVILSETKDLGERWGYKPNNHARSMMEILTVVLPSFDTPRLYSGQELRACPVLDTGMSGRIGGKDSLRMTEDKGEWIPAFAGMTRSKDFLRMMIYIAPPP